MPPFVPFNRQKTCRYGQMLYNIHDQYIGRSLDAYGEFSEGESDLFRQIVQPGQVVIEAGANIGAHTVLLAQLCGTTGSVFAFEPQRISFQTLCANIALNSIPNVCCFPKAVGAKPGTIMVPTLDFHREINFGGLALGEFKHGEPVELVTLDSYQFKQCHFIKADVEGMEKQVLQGAAETIARLRPILYVENDKPDRSDELVRYIDSIDYVMYWHRPFYFNQGNFLANPENVFSNVASFNMLCVHKSVPQNIQGMSPVDIPPAI